jgi:hypothetical protein
MVAVSTARRTPGGYEAIAISQKGQVRNSSGGDIRLQAALLAGLFQVPA